MPVQRQINGSQILQMIRLSCSDVVLCCMFIFIFVDNLYLYVTPIFKSFFVEELKNIYIQKKKGVLPPVYFFANFPSLFFSSSLLFACYLRDSEMEVCLSPTTTRGYSGVLACMNDEKLNQNSCQSNSKVTK